jgi:hypothetical protein
LLLAQARELVKTEAVCPGSAAELLAVAKGQSLKTLKEEARDRRVRSVDPEELHRRQLEAQTWRHWRTSLGMVAFAGELPPEIGIPIVNRIDADTDRLWRQARRQANGELLEEASDAAGQFKPSRAALAAQAFVRLVETGGKGKARAADLVIVCDLEAYRRGHAIEGEACHIVGGGPIPVSLARELGRDALLKAVLYEGTEIHTIAHFGRKTSAVLRTALTLGAPPRFDGIKCSVPGCDRRYYLEQDHVDPVANGGLTSLANMRPLCWLHHLIKTEQDRKAGRLRRKHGKRVKPVKGVKQRKRPRAEGPDPP